MQILIVGSGGREHALAWAFKQGGHEVAVTPGHSGMAACGIRCVTSILEEADLVMIGPEVPLVDGLADYLRGQGRAVLGPSAEAARLEGSKLFAKRIAEEADIPTPDWRPAYTVAQAVLAAHSFGGHAAVKADGLAAGKGVIVCDTLQQVEEAATVLLTKHGAPLVIEERLHGPELSILTVCDGHTVTVLPSARDYKPLLDGNQGPNTGGMGAYAPATPAHSSKVLAEQFIAPTLALMRARETPFVGVLYAGLILTRDGPKLLEYNVRLGDPETQAILPCLAGNIDIAELFLSAAEGRLTSTAALTGAGSAVCITLAAAGYPQKPLTGMAITGLSNEGQTEGDALVFHAGTASSVKGAWEVAGGRILNVVGRGGTRKEAQVQAYEAVRLVAWEGRQYRTDIG